MVTSSGGRARREREREEMRHRITQAARHLFVTEGYASTTIRRIADAIEYTPGAIYSYFADKDAIFYALHQQGFFELQQRFVAAIGAGGNPAAQLRRVGEAYLAFARDNPEMYHLMFIAQATSRSVDKADAWPEGKAAYETIRALVQVAVTSGWIRPADPDVVAFALWSAAHGAVALEICHRQAVLPLDRRAMLTDHAFAYVLRSILTERPRVTPPGDARVPERSPEVAMIPRGRRGVKER